MRKPRFGGVFFCSTGTHDVSAENLQCSYTAEMRTTVTITARGLVTLPAKLRAALGLKADDLLIAEVTPDGILLRPAVTLPLETYSDKRVREFDAAESELAKVLVRKKKKQRR